MCWHDLHTGDCRAFYLTVKIFYSVSCYHIVLCIFVAAVVISYLQLYIVYEKCSNSLHSHLQCSFRLIIAFTSDRLHIH